MSEHHPEKDPGTDSEYPPVTRVTRDPVISNDIRDLLTPGVQVEVDPEEAERLGAFEETALSEEDAWDSNADLVDLDDEDA